MNVSPVDQRRKAPFSPEPSLGTAASEGGDSGWWGTVAVAGGGDSDMLFFLVTPLLWELALGEAGSGYSLWSPPFVSPFV